MEDIGASLRQPTVAERIEVLRRRPPFDGLEAPHLDWLAGRMEQVSYQRGTVLMIPGQEPQRFHFILKGAVRIEAMGRSAHDKVLAEFEEGGCFPIEALHEQRPVFSTYRTTDEVVTWEISAADFLTLQQNSENFRSFCDGRSASLLEQSRQLFQTHFAHNRPDRQSLDSPLASIAVREPQTCLPDTPLRVALETMGSLDISTMIVADAERRPLGIFTLRDLLHRVALSGQGTDRAISEVMTPDPCTLPAQAMGSEAAMVMARHGFRHVLVVEDRKLVGIVSERDLFGLQRVGLSQISGAIRTSKTEEALVRYAGDIRQLAHNLIEQGVGAEQLTQIVSTLNDQLTCRILELELAAAEAAGRSLADLRFCWLALGSEGRHEQTLSTDQDNGIIFLAPEGLALEAVRARLLPFAQAVNRALDACGFTLCKGNIMAGNPMWCLSLDEWRDAFGRWLDKPEPEALLNATIFFDFRPVFGEAALADSLRGWLTSAARGNTRLFHLLVENALQRSAPLGLIRDFVTDQEGMLDLKLSGITLFVDAARIMALATGVADGSTRQRLRLAADAKGVPAAEVEAWIDAFHFIQSIRLRHQHEQHVQRREMTNRISPSELNRLDRKIFIESLRQSGSLQKRVQQMFGMKAM
jgi:CBS domain-containing protein